MLTDPQRIELIREIRIEFVPKNIINKNIGMISIFSVVYSPVTFTPNQWLTNNSLAKLSAESHAPH